MKNKEKGEDVTDLPTPTRNDAGNDSIAARGPGRIRPGRD
jgi:hypothetical protein